MAMSPFLFVGLELRGDVLGKSGGGGLAGSCGPVQKAVTGTRPELPGGDQFRSSGLGCGSWLRLGITASWMARVRSNPM